MSDEKEEKTVSEEVPFKECDNIYLFNKLQLTLTLLDVRSRKAYDECHIYKAIQVSLTEEQLNNKGQNIAKLSELESSHQSKLERIYGEAVIVYGDENTDTAVFETLQKITKTHNKHASFRALSRGNVKLFFEKYEFLLQRSTVEGYSKPLQQLPLENVINTRGYPSQILDDTLFLGSARHAVDGYVMYLLGITHVVNVTRLVPNSFSKDLISEQKSDLCKDVHDHFEKKPIEYLQLKIIDADSEDISESFQNINEFMDSALNEPNNKVFVHCQMGISRSSTVVMAYLMKYHKMKLSEAYIHCRKRRPHVCPNDGFLRQLIKFEMDLYGAHSLEDIQRKHKLRLKFQIKPPKKAEKKRDFRSFFNKLKKAE